MKTTTEQNTNGIQWTQWIQLEELDFADDLALLSHSQQQKKKTEISAQVRLKMNEAKTKIFRINTNSISSEGNKLRSRHSQIIAALYTERVKKKQILQQELGRLH